MAKKRAVALPLSPDEAKRMVDQADLAISKFSSGIDGLESAPGVYLLGRHLGWMVLYLVHSKKTLGITLRDELPEEGPAAAQSVADIAAQAFTNFWKIVSGEQKLELDRDQRKALE
jgi:hypothetical protein